MIEVKAYQLPEVVNQMEVKEFKNQVRTRYQHAYQNVPDEVKEFITALSDDLGDFAQFGKDVAMITGYELQLCGLTEWEGEKIHSSVAYPIEVPRMQAVDNATTMLQIYHKRGKSGLISYCKMRVKGTKLERLLDVLNVHVFHQNRPEFIKIMKDISNTRS